MIVTRMNQNKMLGVTLVELILVLVIIASAFTMYTQYVVQKGESVRIDRTLLQIQQIQNAASAYYIANGQWPGTNCTVVTLSSGASSSMQPTFLPDSTAGLPTQWGTAGGAIGYYSHYFCSSENLSSGNTIKAAMQAGVPANAFVVDTYIGSTTQRQSIGKILAGRLPGSIFASPYLYSFVTIPPQSLNKLGAIKFGGLYHHGACIPVPVCPTATVGNTTATAQIFLVPTSVSGVNDNSPSTSVYPVSSFTAFASGTPSANPAACKTGGSQPACTGGNSTGIFWRACIQIITERGDVSVTRSDASASDEWGQQVTMAAFTRCAPPNEKFGSDFSIYGD